MDACRYVRCLLVLALILCVDSLAGTKFLPVPIDGGWSSNEIDIEPGKAVSLQLEITPARDLDYLSVRFNVGEGLSIRNGLTDAYFSSVEKGEDITIIVDLSTTTTAERTLIAHVVVNNSPELYLAKSFVLVVNRAASTPSDSSILINKDNLPVIVY